MARIVHRHRLPSLAPAPGLRRLPVPGRVFLALAVVVAALEVWPAVNAAWLVGVTDVVDELARVLPTAFRTAAVVALPAAILWAEPRAQRVNPWLWKGSLIVAAVQLARYPLGLVQDALIETAQVSEAGAASPEFAVASVIGLLLAFMATLGIWALSEGLKDAGARLHAVVVAALAVAVVAVVIITFGPSVVSAIEQGGDPLLPVNIVSVLANGLYLFALALLGGRAVAGALRRLEPRIAWVLGAIAAVSLAAVPVASLGLTLMNSLSQAPAPESLLTALRLSVFIGWPLLAVALGMGMGAVPVRHGEAFRARRHVLVGATRVTPRGPVD